MTIHEEFNKVATDKQKSFANKLEITDVYSDYL